MSLLPPAWDRGWVADQASALAMRLFRLVETQHIAATMRLVDSTHEQDLLEQMLEQSKPPMPDVAHGVHHLLAAPFRYFPQTGSRFRAVNTPGVWYGADDAYCACSEMAYWRQRFLLDSAGLAQQELNTEHSMYQAEVSGVAIDLLSPPWVQAESLWMHTSRYNDTQELGSLARQAGHVAWIRYKSVRAPGHTCGAVFNPNALRMVTPEMQYEHWYCRASKDRITFSNGRKRFDF
jgi:RES domain